MSNATSLAHTAGMITHVERVHCPQCDGAIPNRLVLSHIEPPSDRDIRTRRTTMCRCEHCNKTWFAQATLRGAQWCLEEDTVREVVQKRELAKFDRDLSKKLAA